MNRDDIKLFKIEVFCKRFINIKEVFNYWCYCLNDYIECVRVFGTDSEVSKDVRKIFREFLNIMIEENKILKYLLDNAIDLDACECDEFMIMMYELFEDTIEYYYNILEGIEVACAMGDEWRAKRPIKKFKTLLDTRKYHDIACGIMLMDSDIESFLGYPKDFWDYVDSGSRTIVLDSHVEEKDFYGANLKIDNDKLVDLKIFVPYIVNLETALVNVHVFKNAYDLYKLGCAIKYDDLEYEMLGFEKEKEFKERYMPIKRLTMFKK